MLCLLLSFIIAIGVFYETVVFPSVEDYIISLLQTKILNLISESVSYVLSQEGLTYDDFVKIKTNNDDTISTIEIDTVTLNRIKSGMAKLSSKLADNTEDITAHVPLGTVFGSSLFSGTGPLLPFSVKTTSSVFADYISEFTDAGINQTLHRIIIKIRCESTLIVPLHQSKFTTNSDFIMAQSVIVGDVPENYTVVIENGSAIEDTVSNIFDYGTVN